jgi:hypothetical protein
MSNPIDTEGTLSQAVTTCNNTGEETSASLLSTMSSNHVPSIACISATESLATMRASKILDQKQKNWTSWSQSIDVLFNLLEVKNYVDGKVLLLDKKTDPVGAHNWYHNNNYTCMLIISNISLKEKINLGNAQTSHQMWLNLQSMHKSTSYLIYSDYFHMLMMMHLARGRVV